MKKFLLFTFVLLFAALPASAIAGDNPPEDVKQSIMLHTAGNSIALSLQESSDLRHLLYLLADKHISFTYRPFNSTASNSNQDSPPAENLHEYIDYFLDNSIGFNINFPDSR